MSFEFVKVVREKHHKDDSQVREKKCYPGKRAFVYEESVALATLIYSISP